LTVDAWTVSAAGTAAGLPAVSMMAALIGIALGVVALLALVAYLQSRERDTDVDYIELKAGAEELYQHAVRVAQKMTRARSVAAQARARWLAAEDVAEAARQAHDLTEATLEQVRYTAAQARATRENWPPHPVAYQGREQDISRAALAAYRRGDISVDELREVFRRAGDWDPVLEQHDQEVERAAVVERQARRAYTDAVMAARAAGEQTRIAEVAAQALSDEAAEAAAEASEAGEVAASYAPRSRKARARPRNQR
jgi:hypothetical protein